MACGSCAAARAARAAKSSTNTQESGSWSLTLLNGERTFYETRLAALAANAKAGGKGLVRRVS